MAAAGEPENADHEPLVQAIRPVALQAAAGAHARGDAVRGRGSGPVRIFALENQADEIKNELRSHLPRSFFMPVDRRDLLEILDLQDSIADTAQDIAGTLVLRRPKVLEPIREPLMVLTQRCLDACNQLARIMEELDELLETGFKGRESEMVVNMIDDLNKTETDTDQKAMDLLRELFAHEQEIDPVSLMIWHRLIRWVGDLANYSEKVGNRLRLLLAR
jgi:predicted phosphate transport protein (TIGR00153 family)